MWNLDIQMVDRRGWLEVLESRSGFWLLGFSEGVNLMKTRRVAGKEASRNRNRKC